MELALAPIVRHAAALALLAAPLPAVAQSLAGSALSPTSPVGATYFNASKTEAILGGAPSRLATILASQTGVPIQQFQAPVPASYGAGTYRAVATVARSPVASDRPDVFGSVALPIDRTPLDYRWRKVRRASASFVSASYAARLGHLREMERIDAVNRYVNARVTFVDDIRQYRAADHWTTAAETLRRGKGDCEDFAIAKLQLLRRAGFADKDLYLVILRDLTRRADHAVLVVRSEGRLWVLDNGTDRIVDSADINDYRPIMTFSAGRSWTHGYRRAVQPMIIASRSPAPAVTMTAGVAGFVSGL